MKLKVKASSVNWDPRACTLDPSGNPKTGDKSFQAIVRNYWKEKVGTLSFTRELRVLDLQIL
jgi:hypothetical protein